MSFAGTVVQVINNRLFRVLLGIGLFAGVFTAGIVWSSLDNVEQRRNYLSAIDQAARLSAKNAQLEKENRALNARIAGFERKLQVNQIAYDKLTGQLSESASYINELREDLDFYQSIISPQDNKAGVRVQAFTVEPSKKGGFNYRTTVVQALKHDNSVVGSAEVSFEGDLAGRQVRIRLDDIGDPPSKLSFRYFQVLEGGFNFPNGFTPERIRIQLITSQSGKSKKNKIESVYEWDRILRS